MSVHGLDWAWWQPSRKQLEDLDTTFACRYLATLPNSKVLTREEAERLSKAWSIWLVVVWETTANRATKGFQAGRLDAAEALRQARALGMPELRPIYFAVDFDATNFNQIKDYFAGLVNELGVERVGVYGSFDVCRWLKLNELATWFWQTYAWSGGRWFDGNHIEQYKNLANYDHNRAKQDDYGQWMPGVEPDMALSNEDIEKIAKAVASEVWTKDGYVDSPASYQAAQNAAGQEVNTHWKGESYMTGLWSQNEQIMAQLTELKNLVQATGGGQAAASAEAIVDELASRLVERPY